MAKLDKQSSLKKCQDPEIWITDLEDIQVRLDDKGSSILDSQFTIHVLNNITPSYGVQFDSIQSSVESAFWKIKHEMTMVII